MPKQTRETNIEGSVSTIMTRIVARVQLPPPLKIGEGYTARLAQNKFVALLF